MTLKPLAALALLCLPALLHAQGNTPIDYDARYAKCLKDAGGANNTSVATCANGVAEAAFKEITQLHSQILSTLTKHDKNNAAIFEGAHKAWGNYRDAQCKLSGFYVGSPMYNFCPMQLNIARVKELRAFEEASRGFGR